ncbi:MAG: (d)CMP kinase [Bdellovibrionota bacterium]
MTLKLVEEGSRATPARLPIVAIDGPAGAGKSTAARLLAYRLGFLLIDTGALYRVLALTALDQDVSLADGKTLAALALGLEIQFGKLEIRHEGDIPRLAVFCNGADVTDKIRAPELGMAASNVSKLPEVREALLALQRKYGDTGGIVMEGRDIGTVIFPDADVKFFLTASVESRARRRWDELTLAGADIALEQVIRETRMRDDQDSNRPIAPLKQAPDAILIDSTSRSLDDVVGEMASTVRLRCHQ